MPTGDMHHQTHNTRHSLASHSDPRSATGHTRTIADISMVSRVLSALTLSYVALRSSALHPSGANAVCSRAMSAARRARPPVPTLRIMHTWRTKSSKTLLMSSLHCAVAASLHVRRTRIPAWKCATSATSCCRYREHAASCVRTHVPRGTTQLGQRGSFHGHTRDAAGGDSRTPGAIRTYNTPDESTRPHNTLKYRGACPARAPGCRRLR